jgi:transposase
MNEQAMLLKSVTTPATERPDPEVREKAQRRQFSATYRQQILEEADRCSEPGQINALLRREGLYSSHLSTWRQQRAQALAAQRRGRKPWPHAQRLATLERDNERLRAQLAQAQAIIEVQKKLSALLALQSGQRWWKRSPPWPRAWVWQAPVKRWGLHRRVTTAAKPKRIGHRRRASDPVRPWP